MKEIYMDHNATTPVHPEVMEAMLPFFSEHFGNPSSIHWAGREVKKGIETARESVAAFLKCDPKEIIFTAGGSESNNLAIKGVCEALKEKGNHIITTKVEHAAVLHTCEYMEKQGFQVTYLPVNMDGMINLEDLVNAITDKTILITIMFANNETGTIFPIAEIGKIARERKIAFHTDAVQAAGKIALDVNALNVDLLTISAHKLYGPKGVGGLYARKGAKLKPLIHGGGQERNRTAGTENVTGIVGMGKACEIAMRDMDAESERLLNLRERLHKGLIQKIEHVKLNGHPTMRLNNTLNVSFEYVEGESLLLNLDMDGVAASSGSACSSGSLEPSHVLTAMGLPHEVAHGSVRFSLGRSNTAVDIDKIIEIMPPIVERLRAMSPLYGKVLNPVERTTAVCQH
ncbi:MAG: cysteine desulfurase NifS [Deltaproteobacteria bacterium]